MVVKKPTQNDQLRPLILDVGSNMTRLGWAGDDFPDVIAPSIYVEISDYLYTSDVIDGLEDIYIQDSYESHLVGHDALKYQNILRMHEFKKENNYAVLLKFFLHYYNKLEISNECKFRQPIIFLTPFFISELEKTKIQELFLNKLNFPCILFLSESQAILSTLQKSSGVVVNIGESNTYISTIFHGFTNIMARDLFPIAGKELTNYFLNLILAKKGSGKVVYMDKFIAKEIKEKISLCILDPEGERKRIKEGLTKYDRIVDLPDGTSLKVNQERFLLAEPLLNPKLIHIDYVNLAEAIAKVIRSWDRENWEELVPSIIISGGTSLITGLNERLELELKNYFSEKLGSKIKVIAVSGRENMGWIGASILYSKDQLKKGWVNNPSIEVESKEEINSNKSEG